MKRGLFAVALALACAHRPEPAPALDFARFADEFWEEAFAFAPSSATAAGVHQRDGELEDFSRPRLDARVAALKRSLARLSSFDRSALSFDDRIDARILESEIRGRLLGLEVVRSWERNPMAYAGVPGNAIDGLMKREFAPAAERLRSAISRLEQVPRLYAAGRENLTDPPREFTDLAIRMTRGSIDFFSGPVAEWARLAAAGDASLLARFDRTNAAAVAAAREFHGWLERDLLPRSTGSYALGPETFLRKLAIEELIELPLPELLGRGEAQLAKDRKAFLETARKIDPSKPAAEVYAALADDHPTAEDLLPSVRRSVEAARQFVVQRRLVEIPSEVRVRIEETPTYDRVGSFASMDTPGPYESKATEAFYYVTPVEPEWDAKHKEEHLRAFSTYVLAMTNVHEAYPGHYLQFLYAPSFPTKTRKLSTANSNVEGWAHYAEEMLADQGFGGGDPRMRLAQLEEALLRDCRYVAGIKLHTAGWSVAQGQQLFVDQCFQEPANAFEEARRGTYDPTYLYYTFGKIEIQRMAREYMARKGKTLEQFHGAFLTQGGFALPLVQEILFR